MYMCTSFTKSVYYIHMYVCPLQAMICVVCIGFAFGIISSFSPEYYTLLLFRGLLGFAFGGVFLGYGRAIIVIRTYIVFTIVIL